jgi:translation initiation factor IF-2
MKKIRINELARELEVKAHEILERLPELGVTEKKTHSSSIDEDVAIRLRVLYGVTAPVAEAPAPAPAQAPEPAPGENRRSRPCPKRR